MNSEIRKFPKEQQGGVNMLKIIGIWTLKITGVFLATYASIWLIFFMNDLGRAI